MFDLDPPEGVEFSAIRAAALAVGERLRDLGLAPFAMTTGSRGYHVTVALQRRAAFDEVREFARRLARLAAGREPRLFTNEQRKAKREGKILIDIQRNAYAHTSVAPYAVRARPNAPVATPLHWEELDDSPTRADRWTVDEVPRRLERDGDPWNEIGRHAQTLAAPRRRLDELIAEAGIGE